MEFAGLKMTGKSAAGKKLRQGLKE